MYCFQPPLQHMYCASQPPFHQVGLGQVGMRSRISGYYVGLWCVGVHMRAFVHNWVGR